jgi:hypothetical protein
MLPTKKAAAAVCRHCGAELVTQRAGARYCNDRCRLRAHRSGPGRVVRAELSVSGTSYSLSRGTRAGYAP